jgi:hypothetical protein
MCRWTHSSVRVVAVDGDDAGGTKGPLHRCPKAITQRAAAKTANARPKMTSSRRKQRNSDYIHSGRTDRRCPNGRDSFNTNRERRLIQ